MNKFTTTLCIATTLLTTGAMAGWSNLVINGSFEDNSATATINNMSNDVASSTIQDFHAFGAGQEIDLMHGQSPEYGDPPVDGMWKIGIVGQNAGPGVDAFSLSLHSTLVAGQMYDLQFWAQGETTFVGLGSIEVGISAQQDSFGTLISSYAMIDAMLQFNTTFTATIDAAYLTVRGTDQGGWSHLDAFSLTTVPGPSAVALLAFSATLRRRRRRS
jgi:hypothetical protein